jgi:hypothetical protein
MPVRLGGTRNPREQWFFDPDDGYKIKTMYTSDQIDKAYKDGNINNPYVIADPKVLFAHESPRIDPIDKEFREFVAQTFYDKDKKPLEQFLMKEESTVEYTDANGNKMQKIVKGWNEPAVLAAWQNYVGAKAKSYSKYPNQAKALWDTVLEQGRNILTTDKQGNPTQTYSDGYALSASDGTPGTALTAIDTGVFAESMLSYAGNFMPPEGEVISKSKVIKPEKATEAEKEDFIQTQKAKNFFKRVEDYLDSTKGLPVPPPGLLFVNAQLTDEGRRFKSDLQKLVRTTGGKVVEFTEDAGTQEVFADIKYGDADIVTITEAQFRDPNVFRALLEQATGVDVTGSGVVKASYFNKYKDNK